MSLLILSSIISCMNFYERGRGGLFGVDVGVGGGVGTQDGPGPPNLNDR